MTKFRYKGRRLLVDGADMTATAAELNANAGVVAGTAAALKALVLDAAKGIGTITSAIITTLTTSTIAGGPAFSTMFRIPINADVAGAGSIQGDAAALSTGFTVITGANGSLGWRLPVPSATFGDIVIVKGTTAGVAKLWPNVGGQINAVGADTAMSLASGVIPAILIAKSATQWYTLPLLPS